LADPGLNFFFCEGGGQMLPLISPLLNPPLKVNPNFADPWLRLTTSVSGQVLHCLLDWEPLQEI